MLVPVFPSQHFLGSISLENKVLSRMLLGGEMGEESLFCFWPYSLPYRQMSLISEPVCSSLAGICPGISRFYFLHQAKSISFSTSKAADVTDSLWSPVTCPVGLHPFSTLVYMQQQREAWVSSVYPVPSQPLCATCCLKSNRRHSQVYHKVAYTATTSPYLT